MFLFDAGKRYRQYAGISSEYSFSRTPRFIRLFTDLMNIILFSVVMLRWCPPYYWETDHYWLLNSGVRGNRGGRG